MINTDIFLILTEVENVKLNFNKPDEKSIDKMTLDEAKNYLEEVLFLPRSMGLNGNASIRFIEWRKNALVTSLYNAIEVLEK